jgi:large exoprotein involved in heme utilization and adhesion
VSSIDGVLQSEIAGANLFLLNPSGVLFGPNASLEVSGSFHVSTADYLRFTDGVKFSANLGQASVLTAASPAAFGFLGQNPAPITIQGSMLQVPAGEALSVVGGDVEIVGRGPLTTGGVPTLSAPGGRIQLASVASPGEVGFSPLELAPDLQLDSVARLGRIALSQGAHVTVSSDAGAGTVLIRGGRLTVNHAFIDANTGAGEGARLGIDVRVAEEIVLTNEAQMLVDSLGAGHAGDLQLMAGRSIAIVGHSAASLNGLSSRAAGSGDAGRIAVWTPILTMEGAVIQAGTTPGSHGYGGALEVRVGRLALTGGARLTGGTEGAGRGGELTVVATDAIDISGVGLSEPGGFPSMSGLFSSTSGQGDAGRLFVSAPRLTMDHGALSTSANPGSEGNAGDLEVRVGRLALTGGAQISSSTFGAGRGGNIEVQARQIELSNVGTILASSSGAGDAGTIRLQVGETFRSQHGAVTTATSGAGGGAIALTAGRLVQLRNSALTTSVQGGGGDAGNLTLEAPFVIADRSQIIANAFEGRGGNISLLADVFLASPDSLVSASSALGIPGTVDIRAPVTSLSGTLAPLPQTFMHVAALLPARCAARFSGGKASSLVVGGRDGLPAEPSGVLPSPLVIEERLVVDPALIEMRHQPLSSSRFALLANQEKTLLRLGCPK